MWHGAWVWDEVRPLLDHAGVASIAVELPMTSLTEDVAAVRRLLDAAHEPVVLVGHSYGGAVITASGLHPAVSQLVYLAGFALDEGESVSRPLPHLGVPLTRLREALRFSDDGRAVTIDDESARELMYPQAPAGLADAAIRRHRPVCRALFSTPVEGAAWRHLASTYVVCAEDRTVAPQLQRAMAVRAATSLVWPSDHTPHLSHPDLVGQLLTSTVAELR
ncbi:MAG: putative hydrolase [Pseudonocardiales bacterium]|nr:putative hydrolase [Pseudonocardiales bacterium]